MGPILKGTPTMVTISLQKGCMTFMPCLVLLQFCLIYDPYCTLPIWRPNPKTEPRFALRSKVLINPRTAWLPCSVCHIILSYQQSNPQGTLAEIAQPGF